MLAVILSFLKSHLPTMLIASGILSVFATISIQHLEIAHAEKKLAQCRAESITLKDSNRALVASVERQNAAIAALASESEAKRRHAAQALAAARIKAGRHEEAARRIEAQGESKDGCADLRALVNEFVGRR